MRHNDIRPDATQCTEQGRKNTIPSYFCCCTHSSQSHEDDCPAKLGGVPEIQDRLRSAQAELAFKARYMSDKENHWTKEAAAMDERIQDQKRDIESLTLQIKEVHSHHQEEAVFRLARCGMPIECRWEQAAFLKYIFCVCVCVCAHVRNRKTMRSLVCLPKKQLRWLPWVQQRRSKGTCSVNWRKQRPGTSRSKRIIKASTPKSRRWKPQQRSATRRARNNSRFGVRPGEEGEREKKGR